MTYDEFLDKYSEHMEGRNDGDDRRPFTAEGAESKDDGKEEQKLEEGNTSMDKAFESVNKSR